MESAMAFGPGAAQDRFSRYFSYAVAAHVVVFGAMAFVPNDWLSRDDAEENIMIISLGGAPGPRLGGLNQIDARPVQEATPEPERPQFQAPVAKTPVMAVPDKPAAKPAPPTKTPIQSTPIDRSSSRTPIRGAETREGQARIETGAKTAGTGLSLGGGEQGTGGETNLTNFCCPVYLDAMVGAIYRIWKQNQGVEGVNTMRFVIERDGRISSIELVKPSGNHLLDRESRVVLTNLRMPALPREFTEPRLIVRLNFEYKR